MRKWLTALFVIVVIVLAWRAILVASGVMARGEAIQTTADAVQAYRRANRQWPVSVKELPAEVEELALTRGIKMRYDDEEPILAIEGPVYLIWGSPTDQAVYVQQYKISVDTLQKGDDQIVRSEEDTRPEWMYF